MHDAALPQLVDQIPTLVQKDVVIIGGGPAGIAAALELARLDIDVLLIDEHGAPGGQYFKPRAEGLVSLKGEFRPRGAELRAELDTSSTELWASASVWGVSDDRQELLVRLDTAQGSVQHRVRAQAFICATGAYEAMIPFTGWTSPQVISAGHALHLATCDGVKPGKRVLVAGSGPFLLQVACELIKVGCTVEAVVEAGTPYAPSVAAASSIRFPARIKEFLQYRGMLALHRVPVFQGAAVSLVEPQEDGSARAVVTKIASGSSQEFHTDTVAVGFGFRPSTELPRMLGCEMTMVEPDGEEFVRVHTAGRTSRPDVFAVGEISGIAGVHAAMARGKHAALAIARDLGRPISTKQINQAAARTARLDAFAVINRSLFPFPEGLYSRMERQTVACRCEAVTVGKIQDEYGTGWNDRDSVKGFTRAGMGPCQGRECFRTLQWLTGGSDTGNDSASMCHGSAGPMPQSSRIPIKPLDIKDLLEDAEPNPPGTGESESAETTSPGPVPA